MILNYLQLAFMTIAWQKIAAGAEAIDDLLSGASGDQKRAVLVMLMKKLRVCPQLLAICTGAVAGVVAALALVGASSGAVHRCAASDITAFTCGAIAGHSAYWIITGALFCRALLKINDLKVRWNAPIDTRGLIVLSEGARITARLGFVLFIFTMLPLTYAYHKSPTLLMTSLYFGTIVIAGGLVTLMGLGVQLWLSRRALKAKRRILEEIATEIERLRSELETTQPKSIDNKLSLFSLKANVDIYRQIDSTRPSFVDAAIITQYSASLIAVLLQGDWSGC
jgi:hypothetical protein